MGTASGSRGAVERVEGRGSSSSVRGSSRSRDDVERAGARARALDALLERDRRAAQLPEDAERTCARARLPTRARPP